MLMQICALLLHSGTCGDVKYKQDCDDSILQMDHEYLPKDRDENGTKNDRAHAHTHTERLWLN